MTGHSKHKKLESSSCNEAAITISLYHQTDTCYSAFTTGRNTYRSYARKKQLHMSNIFMAEAHGLTNSRMVVEIATGSQLMIQSGPKAQMVCSETIQVYQLPPKVAAYFSKLLKMGLVFPECKKNSKIFLCRDGCFLS